MERLFSIYSVLSSWTISLWISFMSILPDITISITVTIVTIIIWLVAFVRCWLPGIFISFHHVKFWAPNSVNLISITVIVLIFTWIWISILILSRHFNKIQSSGAAAAMLREINIIFPETTIHIRWIKIVWTIWITCC